MFLADSDPQSPQEPGRILVTGGAGLIGSHLTRALVTRGHEVIVVDDFSTGSTGNLADLVAGSGLTVVTHDVVDPLPDLGAAVDTVAHLACPASPRNYQADPVRTVDICVRGSSNVLTFAEAHAAKVVFASTSEVYGDPAQHPQSEEYWGHVNPVGPRSCYDEGKRCAEALMAAYRRSGRVATTTVRIFNTYGPGMGADDGRVIPTFVDAALRGTPLPVHGDGSQVRSFCYVDDTVDAFVRLLYAEHSYAGPVNVGNPEPVSIAELAAKVGRAVGGEVTLNHRPRPEDDPHLRCPDISKIKADLGWHPTVDLDSGLTAVVAWMRDSMAGPHRTDGTSRRC